MSEKEVLRTMMFVGVLIFLVAVLLIPEDYELIGIIVASIGGGLVGSATVNYLKL
jgi:hypothetical protein